MRAPTDRHAHPWSIFLIFLRLGLTAFGGPVAHLGFFRETFVVRRRWLSDQAYADLLALCQFLPGPASSQVGLAIGLSRAGYRGAFAAWLGFTLPSAVALILCALSLARYGQTMPAGILSGLKIAAVAVVAQAVWGMAKTLCPDPFRLSIMTLAACGVLLLPGAGSHVTVIMLAGVLGWRWLRGDRETADSHLHVPVSRRAGVVWLGLFATLLILLPIAAASTGHPAVAQFDAFYRAGALVFGGGHVVLPMLQAEVVQSGWVAQDTFLAGYGLTQAVPGPLFTFAAFLGASMQTGPSGWIGGALCLAAIFVPAFLLVAGTLPFWQLVRHHPCAQGVLRGVNAAVVGLLLAALYDPVWTSAISTPADFALALVALIALAAWKLPAWAVVLGCAAVYGIVTL